MKPSFGAYSKEFELINRSLKRVPAIARCTYLHDKIQGFFILLVFHDMTQTTFDVTVLSTAYPSNIRELIASQNQKNNYPVIVAPYVSKESAAVCAHHNIGYFDRSGNCRLALHCLYVSDQGHPNKFIEKRTAKTIFDPSSRVSSRILREIMRDVTYQWKLKHLSGKVGCSIGQVSKVKDYLSEQLWVRMSKDGLRILEPKAIMQAWSEEYSQKSASFEVVNCYTLLPIPEFEDKVRAITKSSGLACYLTGFSGGARYAPVVRYNRAHILAQDRDIDVFLEKTSCKKVESGANVHIQAVTSSELLYDVRTIKDYQVASPVQVYLDCMRLKGRGEEMAEAILTKEILK